MTSTEKDEYRKYLKETMAKIAAIEATQLADVDKLSDTQRRLKNLAIGECGGLKVILFYKLE